MSLKLKDVTLVCVSSIKHEESMSTMLDCMDKAKFDRAVFVSNRKADNQPRKVDYVHVEPILSMDGYSRYIMYDLYAQFKTSHCLIVQYDGGIMHPDMWQPEFMNYDYIGAPWLVATGFKNQFGEQCRVGNGGFSLRSWKLLALPRALNVTFDLGFCRSEDLSFCLFNRHLYEKEGCKFAPIEVARHFSHEIPMEETRGITPFGAHGSIYKEYAKKRTQARGWWSVFTR
jgi:hypothetical protein